MTNQIQVLTPLRKAFIHLNGEMMSYLQTNILNTLLEALGEFDDPEIRRAVEEIAMNDSYPLEIRIKAIDKLSEISDKTVIPSLMPILSDYNQYKLHSAVIQTVKNLGAYNQYEQEIKRRTFEAHQKASSINE